MSVSSELEGRGRKGKGTYSFLDLGPIGLLVLFVGRQLFGCRHLMGQLRVVNEEVRTYCCDVFVLMCGVW